MVVTNRSLVENGSADVSGGRAPREKRKSGIAGSRIRRMMGPGKIVVGDGGVLVLVNGGNDGAVAWGGERGGIGG